jgi:TfoX/Sxy family transcriptional regulator of competence genes
MERLTKPEPSNAGTLFTSIVQKMLKERGVTQAKMFGVSGLKIGRKMFVMSVKSELVIKLPKEQVNILIASKQGKRFYHLFGKSRIMKEWVSIGHKYKSNWLKLAQEAKDFVASAQKR